ncbi:MAG: hypothetical protein KDA88_15265, partial [Planctomycetaceae bacterium]|nr:hypothetical protein [Planctomycetaceae bacterium]
KILAELEDLYADIGDSSRLADVRSKVDLFFLNTEEQFLSSEAENMKRLREMLRDFTRWMRATLNMHDTVTVLGM